MNAVGRSWTLIGNIDSGPRIAVDRRGLVTGRPGRWSLDWWIRAGEDWLFPSSASAVRQRLVDGAPVVETIVRVPGGDVVHSAFAARVPDDATVIEITNGSSDPIAVALAIRPYDVQGGGLVSSIELEDRDLVVDGELALVMERAPAALVVGSEGTDPAWSLDEIPTTPVTGVECAEGRASSAAVFPLVHGSTLRLVLPGGGPPTVTDLPSADSVARGWGQHAVGALRAVLPAGRVADAFDATRQATALCQAHRSIGEPVLGPPPRPRDDLDLLSALSELGYAGAAHEVLLDRARRQDPRGQLTDNGRDVTASTLAAARVALELAPDPELATALSEVIAQGARWLVEHQDLPLSASGLDGARAVLATLGATSASSELDRILAEQGAPNAEPGPAQAAEGLATEPNGPLGFDLLSTADALLEDARLRPAEAWARLEALLDVASTTWSWPTFVHPRLHTGTGGAGHDLRISAAVARAIRTLLVSDRGSAAVEVARHWPSAWLGTGVEVHGLPSCHGPVSWAVRWHGDRPALLWDVDGAPADLVVAAPGLDPTWRGSGPAGEALLASVEAPEPGEADAADLPSGPQVDEVPESGSFG